MPININAYYVAPFVLLLLTWILKKALYSYSKKIQPLAYRLLLVDLAERLGGVIVLYLLFFAPAVYFFLLSRTIEIIEFLMLSLLYVYPIIVVFVMAPLLPIRVLTSDIHQLILYGRPKAHLIKPGIQKDKEGYFIISHLTDLHFTTKETIEKPLSKESVSSRIEDAFRLAIENSSSHIFLTGDITDQGLPEEWTLFNKALEKIGCPLKSGRVLLIPGNHDLSIATSVESATDARLVYEGKAYNFVNNVLVHCPDAWKYIDDGEWIPLNIKIASLRSYKTIYDKYKPTVKTINNDGLISKILTASGFGTPMGQGHTPKRLIMFPNGFNDAVKKHIDESFWPKQNAFLYSDLLNILYPMVLYESNEFVVVGLNSSQCFSVSLFHIGFGELGVEQLRKFELLSNQIAKMGKTMIILIHHHVSIPKPIRQQLIKTKAIPRWQQRVLQMKDGYALANILKQHRCYVFHGHKHVSYTAKIGHATIISGPSVAFGDKLGGENAYQYAISPKQGLSEIVKSNISTVFAKPPIT